MKTKVLKDAKFSLTGIPANIAIMLVFLILGLAVGVIFAKNGDASLTSEFAGKELVEITRNGIGEYSFLRTFVNLSKYPLIIVFSAFCAFGAILVPIAVFVKGFMISLSVSSLVAALGKSGILCALSVFGIQTLAQIPVLLLISAMSFEVSKAFSSVILPQKYKPSTKSIKIGPFIMFSFSCLSFLLLISFIDFLITPKLVSFISQALFSQ